MREKLLKIINNYGVIPQLKYLQTEVFELNEAIIKHETNGCEYEHITEELADVLVMIYQLVYYYDVDDLELLKTMDFKVDRQLERIRKENENE